MSTFQVSQHICSWAGLSPGNNESAGKRKSSHINKSDPYLKSMLCEVGWVISGKRKLCLSGRYWRSKGAKRATIAFKGTDYHVDLVGADIFPQGFFAVADRLREFKGVNMLCDIGNGKAMDGGVFPKPGTG